MQSPGSPPTTDHDGRRRWTAGALYALRSRARDLVPAQPHDLRRHPETPDQAGYGVVKELMRGMYYLPRTLADRFTVVKRFGIEPPATSSAVPAMSQLSPAAWPGGSVHLGVHSCGPAYTRLHTVLDLRTDDRSS
jgi:hypothetical protein